VDRWDDEDDQGARTEAGNRDVPISGSLLADLNGWRAQTRYAGPEDWVFPTRSGGYRDQAQSRKELHRLYVKVTEATPGLRPRVEPRWHDLRHFAISTWIDANLQAIQTFAGHSDPGTTLRIYGHLFPKESHRENDGPHRTPNL
jgi:integrase